MHRCSNKSWIWFNFGDESVIALSNMILINRRLPNSTTVVQTANDLFHSKINQIRPKNDTFRPLIQLKNLPKTFGIVQLSGNNK